MARRARFLAWYRVLPLAAVLALGSISAVYSYAPALLFEVIYPLRYEEEISRSAAAHGVDPYLVAAVIETESGWDPKAISSQGARGLMQLMPETAHDMVDKGLVAEGFSAQDLEDPSTNIEIGCAYLAYLINYFNGATDRAIAAYNAGMGNVDDWAKEDTVLHNAITFPETQAYLIRVNNAHDRYRQIYPEAFL
ncbi:MAG: lytic transglycosylase domain-containing protein [Collinsella sp.]|nr:lytic transglycosylase domain-containing protein [Collinsella sp.]